MIVLSTELWGGQAFGVGIAGSAMEKTLPPPGLSV